MRNAFCVDIYHISTCPIMEKLTDCGSLLFVGVLCPLSLVSIYPALHLWGRFIVFIAGLFSFPHHHSLTQSFFSLPLSALSLLCAAVAGCPGLRGPGGGSGVQGPRRPSSAGPMVPPGRGDPGLPRFSYSPEKWDILPSNYWLFSYTELAADESPKDFFLFSLPFPMNQSLDLQQRQVC